MALKIDRRQALSALAAASSGMIIPYVAASAEERSGAVLSGTIVWYDMLQGFGYVTPDDGSNPSVVTADRFREASIFAAKKGMRLSFCLHPRTRIVSKIVDYEPRSISLQPLLSPLGPAEITGTSKARHFYPTSKGRAFVTCSADALIIFVDQEVISHSGLLTFGRNEQFHVSWGHVGNGRKAGLLRHIVPVAKDQAAREKRIA